MAESGPFGQVTRMRVLEQYFADAGSITAENAWEHVYRCLLWMNQSAGLAHVYDSNHMQPGGNFHTRAMRFSEELCRRWGIDSATLPQQIDKLFKGCVEEWKRVRPEAIDSELESELLIATEKELKESGIAEDKAKALARKIEGMSREFFTIGKKRNNALGEGFEDLLYILLQRVSKIPVRKIALRKPVSELAGFRRNPPRTASGRSPREPHPDIAIVDDGITQVITTAKWSIRQDRETQFQSEFTSYNRNRIQETELRFALITNEFDVARLDNVARSMPGAAGGYIFHNIYHINPQLLVVTHQDKIGSIAGWISVGKIQALADFLNEMKGRFGEP